MPTQCNQAEVVFLRLEANRVSSSMKPSAIIQSRNVRAFNEGEDDGFENKAERRYDKSVSHLTVSASRAGKDDRWQNTAGPG